MITKNCHTNIQINRVEPFINEQYNGLDISWESNNGWGHYILYRHAGETQWHANSEYMDTPKDKAFLRLLLDTFIKQIEVDT